MEVITEWIRQIILVVIFSALMGLLLPNNQFYKYANVTLGLIVVLTIVTPLVGLTHYDFSNEVLKAMLQMTPSEAVSQSNSMTSINERILLRKYKESIDQAILNGVGEFSTIKVVTVKSEIVEDSSSDDFGSLIGVEIAIKPIEDESIVRKVDKIVIGDQSRMGDLAIEPSSNIDDSEIHRLLSYMRDQWGLTDEKIRIHWEG